MTDNHRLPSFPPAMNMEELRDFAERHCKAGRGGYFPEVRSHYIVAPAVGEDYDDKLRVVFVNGYY